MKKFSLTLCLLTLVATAIFLAGALGPLAAKSFEACLTQVLAQPKQAMVTA